MKKKQILIIFSLLMISQISKAENRYHYTISTHSDYVSTTGCDVSLTTYQHAMNTALQFLVFNENNDIEYAQRHSRDFFNPLLNGKLGNTCLTPSLRKIAEALGFPEDGDVLRAADTSDISKAYPIMTRKEYMETTACLASPSTWEHYQEAFNTYVLGYGDTKSGQQLMRKFLQELGEGHSTDDGKFLDSQCLAPAIKKLAQSTGVLNSQGQFKLQ